jgi:hypothetical protein
MDSIRTKAPFVAGMLLFVEAEAIGSKKPSMMVMDVTTTLAGNRFVGWIWDR